MKAQTAVPGKQAIVMLKEFYTTYMTEVAGSGDPRISEKKLDVLKKRYCTAKLISRLPKLAEQTDADPIINAQDSSPECVKTLLVKPDLKKPNQYIVSYNDGVSAVMIHVSLIQQNGRYMIDNVR